MRRCVLRGETIGWHLILVDPYPPPGTPWVVACCRDPEDRDTRHFVGRPFDRGPADGGRCVGHRVSPTFDDAEVAAAAETVGIPLPREDGS